MTRNANILAVASAAVLVAGLVQSIGAHHQDAGPGPATDSDPPAEDVAYRVTFYTDPSTAPKIEGTVIDGKSGKKNWQRNLNWELKEGEKLEDHVEKWFDTKRPEFNIKVLRLKGKDQPGIPAPTAGKNTMTAPYSHGCHKTIYVNGVPYIVHC